MTCIDLMMNKYRLVRVATLTTAVWMTWVVSRWAMGFANVTTMSGVDAAAVITAVQAPVTLFAGIVFRAYIASRRDSAT